MASIVARCTRRLPQARSGQVGLAAYLSAGLVLAVLVLAPVRAQASNPAASPDRIQALVRQLGSASFAERERATRELTSLGIATREALTAVVNDRDAELRLRARSILAAVSESDFRDRLAAFSADYDGSQKQTLPGWEKFSAAFGGSHQARQLFVEMQQAEPALLEAYARGPKDTSDVLDDRCRELLDQFMHVSSRDSLLTVGTLAALLLAGSSEGVDIDEQLGVQLYTWMIYQPTFTKNAKSGMWSGMMKKLLGLWIVKDSAPSATVQNLIFAASYELKPEGLALAGKILANDAGTPQLRQFALLTIGRFGGKEHLAMVERHLNDVTNCGAIQVPNPPRQVDVQVRDVALGVLIHLTDQQVRDYGAVSVQSSPQSFFQVPALGFPDAAQREAGLKRWAQWRAEHAEP